MAERDGLDGHRSERGGAVASVARVASVEDGRDLRRREGAIEELYLVHQAVEVISLRGMRPNEEGGGIGVGKGRQWLGGFHDPVHVNRNGAGTLDRCNMEPGTNHS